MDDLEPANDEPERRLQRYRPVAPPALPEELDRVVACGLAKDPVARFHTAVELARACAEALDVPPEQLGGLVPSDGESQPPSGPSSAIAPSNATPSSAITTLAIARYYLLLLSGCRERIGRRGASWRRVEPGFKVGEDRV